jgi:hypothetical protein
MKIPIQLLIILLFSPAAVADSEKEAVKQLSRDMQSLESRSSEMSPQEIVHETEGIFDRLGAKSSEENKALIETVKIETSKFYNELADYNTFLNKIADPAFFNFEKVSEINELHRQIALSAEYRAKSEALYNYAENFPKKLQIALENKQFDPKAIQSVLKGISDSEEGKKGTPTKVLNLRVKHAEIVNEGLSWLAKYRDEWNYDQATNRMTFKNPELKEVWKKDIIQPLILVENQLNDAVAKPQKG